MKCGVAGSAAVESEDELVEVGLKMLGAQAVIDAERPGLEVSEDPVDPWQDEVGGHFTDHMRFVAELGSAGVARPAVGLGGAAGGDGSGHEAMEITDRRVHGSDREVPREFDGEAAALVHGRQHRRPHDVDRIGHTARG